MSSLTPVLVIAVLILLNGFFVAAEFAIVGVPRAVVERLAAKGHRSARLVRQILHNPRRQDHYLATAQLGITLASLGLGMYGEHVLAAWLAHHLEALGAFRLIAAHAVASVAAIAILTYFHIVVGEMVPKSLALHYAEHTALWITPPVLVTKAIFYPAVLALNGMGNGVLRLMGITRQLSASYFYTPEELQYVIQESAAGGFLRQEAGQVLRRLFEFGERTAGEIMVPRVRIVGLPPGAPPDTIKETVRRACHTRYPVYQDDLDHIVGTVHIKDLLQLLLAGGSLTADRLHPASYVPETAELDTVLSKMREAHGQMVIVMDEHGGTAGLVTVEDLFEEVVGEIDEGAPGLPTVCRDSTGRLQVSGTARLDEVGEQLGVVLEHEEVDTVSGLVLTLLDRPPVVGDVVTYRDVRFEVSAVRGRGIDKCTVSLATDPDSG